MVVPLIGPSPGCCGPFPEAVPCLVEEQEQRGDRLKLTLKGVGPQRVWDFLRPDLGLPPVLPLEGPRGEKGA